MTPKEHANFPTGGAFLKALLSAEDKGCPLADDFIQNSGQKLPSTTQGIGSLLSMLYRMACCSWGCRGGDHQLEWFAGRLVNQAAAAYRLIRSGYYDEALMLIRGMGESANLLWLFDIYPDELAKWIAADRSTRIQAYGPASVRRRLESSSLAISPIDQFRYQKLCEVGTHPTPGMPPDKFNEQGRPILGVILQPVGVYVCITELGFAISMTTIPLARMLASNDLISEYLEKEALSLTRNLRTFTILNYEEIMDEILSKMENKSH